MPQQPTSENKAEQYRTTLARYLPSSAVEPIFNYLNANSVHFHITRQRTSKLGDYRMPQPRHNYNEISVNGDLSPHFFLIVLLHEMAHLETFKAYGRTVQAHGHEWQQQYRNLLIQYFNDGHFPPVVYPLFKKYISRIPLNRAAGEELERQLRQIDNPTASEILLKDLPVDTLFRLKNKPELVFKVVEKRRTRYRCVEQTTKMAYLVSGNAPIIMENQ